ncbi:MliC family protein [Bartonella rattaustraliani]|uniref:MliC family protein n=1 Tax=Bartonella rattaustraliani TaxID=481139 RepID=UPI0002EF794E|nr:MliC family protein [Bartonella rattaustraliani]
MKKKFFTLGLFTTLSFLFFGSAKTFAGSLIIEVPDTPEATAETITYQCDMEKNKERVEATYHNAEGISLVDFKWKGKRVIASNVIAASGAKYVGGPYIWWTKGDEATFYDLLSDPEEKKPIFCVAEKNPQ